MKYFFLLFFFAVSPSNHGGTWSQMVFSQGLGWRVVIESNGSATISYGSVPSDTAEVPPGIFELSQIEKSVSPELTNESSILNTVAVSSRESTRAIATTRYSNNVEFFRRLFRKAIENCVTRDVKRFRELMRANPPLGIKDIEIRDDQTGNLFKQLQYPEGDAVTRPVITSPQPNEINPPALPAPSSAKDEIGANSPDTHPTKEAPPQKKLRLGLSAILTLVCLAVIYLVRCWMKRCKN